MTITALEICQSACFSKRDILTKIRLRAEKRVLDAIEGSKGAIMISAHLGNWELALLFGACYLQKPMVAVARPFQSKRIESWVHQYRARFGNIILNKKGALPQMVRMLRQGKMLGILIDQDTKPSEGVTVNLFGRTATSTPIAALLARRYGSPVLPVYCIREANGELTVVVEPPLVLRKTDDRDSDLQENTQIMTDAIEKAIRKYPEQWLWFHKRWKRHYPHLYAEDLKKRRRRRKKRRAKGPFTEQE
jgi:KDO2-lipid IV(A) lauroyltransferase